ncbi:MAG: hypothetical protein K6G87_00455 [Butyrivibrio sp.]|uniref:hypothetical protein n=1 Tax=Butyrivibrio sp. TaxID=28121 RepID=UPI0025E8F972|nr:hypothetical protein [Butyrivibrio sp.]MCR5769681.1 hypothetical protein [Butyrivibrio sp.]
MFFGLILPLITDIWFFCIMTEDVGIDAKIMFGIFIMPIISRAINLLVSLSFFAMSTALIFYTCSG